MYNIVLIYLLVFGSECSTTLTVSNCPSSIIPDTSNLTSIIPQDRNQFYSVFNNSQSKNRVQQIILNGDTQDMKTYLTELAFPYIILIIASFIMYLILICCCIFQKTCPPCVSWKRDITKQPYTKSELRCIFIIGIFFSVITLITTIYAFTVLSKIQIAKDQTKCSLFMGIDNVLNGDSTGSWGGFNQIKTQVGNISSLLTAANTSATTNFQNNSWLLTDIQTIKKYNIQIANQNKDSKLITPDPVATAATPLGQSLPKIDSMFIKLGMGPSAGLNTTAMIDQIDTSLKNIQKLSTQGYGVDVAAKQMINSIASIQIHVNSSENTISSYMSQLNILSQTFSKFSNSAFDEYFGYGLYGAQATIGFILAGSLFIIMGIIFTHIYDIIQCRTIIHLGWLIYGITHICVLIFVYIFLSAGSLGHQSCDFFTSFLNNQSSFQTMANIPSRSFLYKIDQCLYGNGDILKQFDISSQMKTISTLFTSITKYYDYENPNSINYVDKTNPSTIINGWLTAMEKYRLGIYKDSNDSDILNSNPDYALNQLNKYTYQGGPYPICSKDRWVFDSANCTNPNQTIYKATSDPNYGLTLSSTNVICISFNEKLANDSRPSWTQSDFRNRYIQTKPNCNQSYEQIIAFGQSLINYRDSRISLFNGLKQSLGNLSNLYSQFNGNLTSFKTSLDSFYSQVSGLNNLVTNSISGLDNIKNCSSAVRDSFFFVHNSFCGKLMNGGMQLGISMVVLSLVMVGGVVSANMFAVRYARYERCMKLNAKAEIGSDISHDLEGGQQNTESSSSSSQD